MQSSSLSINGSYTQNGNLSLTSDSILSNSIPLYFNSGYIDGSGSITGTIYQTSGTIRPGGHSAIGTIHIGNLMQNNASIEIECISDSSYDIVNVTLASFGANSTIGVIFGYLPDNGTVLDGVVQGEIAGNVKGCCYGNRNRRSGSDFAYS